MCRQQLVFTSRCWLSVTAQHESHARTLRSARDLDTWSHRVKKLTLAWLTHISHFYRFNNIILLLILHLSGFANHLLWDFFFALFIAWLFKPLCGHLCHIMPQIAFLTTEERLNSRIFHTGQEKRWRVNMSVIMEWKNADCWETKHNTQKN